MLDGHAQHGELIQPAGHRVARRDHGRQLIDQAVHLVPSAFLNLAVGLPERSKVKSSLRGQR